MNIEQIAHEVSSEMSKEARAMEGRAMMAEFLCRCLSKLAEQAGEPVGYADKYGNVVSKALKKFDHGLANSFDQPLYTETQLLAAQQRTAEACAESVRDAARYRWLRSYNTAKFPSVTDAFYLGDENLDKAIDAARGVTTDDIKK